MFVVSSLEHRAIAANVFSDLSFVLSQTKLFVKRKASADLEGWIIIFELALKYGRNYNICLNIYSKI